MSKKPSKMDASSPTSPPPAAAAPKPQADRIFPPRVKNYESFLTGQKLADHIIKDLFYKVTEKEV